MSQTTEIQIQNQNGLSFRTKLNQMLSALNTVFAGITAPTVTEAGMLWMDTSVSPNVLKRRDSSDTAWEVVPLVESATLAAASKATPVDADLLPLVDSASSNILKKLTWANAKSTLKSYLDGFYVKMSLVASVATTSGTAIDFTGIPSWAKRVTVQFYGISTSGTSPLIAQLGAGAVQTSGYASSLTTPTTSAATGGMNTNTGLVFGGQAAANVMTGHIVITLLGGFNYVATTCGAFEGLSITWQGGGRTTLSGVLDRIRLTTVNGTDTFDAGSVSLLIEG